MIKDLIIELLKIYFRKHDHLIIRHCFLQIVTVLFLRQKIMEQKNVIIQSQFLINVDIYKETKVVCSSNSVFISKLKMILFTFIHLSKTFIKPLCARKNVRYQKYRMSKTDPTVELLSIVVTFIVLRTSGIYSHFKPQTHFNFHLT